MFLICANPEVHKTDMISDNDKTETFSIDGDETQTFNTEKDQTEKDKTENDKAEKIDDRAGQTNLSKSKEVFSQNSNILTYGKDSKVANAEEIRKKLKYMEHVLDIEN